MTLLADIALALGLVITACIFIWEIYLCIRWIAETIVEPAFWWLNDKVLHIYTINETEQWLMWEEWRNRGSGDGPPS